MHVEFANIHPLVNESRTFMNIKTGALQYRGMHLKKKIYLH